MIYKFYFLIFFLFMFVMAAPAFGQEAVIETDVAMLMTTYDDNELAGDQKFKGKRVKISGIISRIAADPDGAPYVGFKTPDNVRGVLQCYFPQGCIDALVKLKKGQNLAPTCTVKGKERSFAVRLEDCVID